jgi:hypothetical protein
MLPVPEGGQGMLHRCGRIAGRLDHDIDRGVRYKLLPIIRQMGSSFS